MDEKGFMISKIQKTKRIFNLEHYASGLLRGAGEDGNREWVTLMACICGDGTYIPPCIIYCAKTGNLQTSWLEDFKPAEHICHFASSEKGWTNDRLGFKWLEIFDRYTKEKARYGRDWRVLWADGHGSHLTMEFLIWCIEHRIHVAVYPSHSTHRLQPLDIGLFSPLASYYSTELNKFTAAAEAYLPVTKRLFFRFFWAAFQKAFTEKNIKSAWKKAGIWPWDPDSVLAPLKLANDDITSDADSESSEPTSRQDNKIPLDLPWRETRKAIDNAIPQQTYNLVERLKAENSILQHRVTAFESVFIHHERSKRRGNNMFNKKEMGESTGWFSPNKIDKARERHAKEQEEEEEQQRTKEQEKIARQEAKAKEQAAVALRKQEREIKKKERELETARKALQRAEAATAKEVSKQLQSVAKSANQWQKRTASKQSQFEAQNSDPEIAYSDGLPGRATTRAGRSTRPPQRYLN